MFSFEDFKGTQFIDHINKSIPGYDVLLNQIASMVPNFIYDHEHTVIDLGCATGTLSALIASKIGYSDGVWGLEYLDSMIENAVYPNVIKHDITDTGDYAEGDTSVDVFSLVFVLQFLNPTQRAFVLNKVYRELRVGGALFVAEKHYASSAFMQDLLQFTNYDHKRASFSGDDILAKQDALRSTMHITTHMEFQDELYVAGFKNARIEKFWQSGQFHGYLIIKG